MNWNKDKSVKLSKFCVCLFMLILAGVCIGAPWLFRLLIRLRVQDLAGKFELFLVSTYTAAVPAAAALYGLWRLLRNISEGEVFIPENVSILRLLSWCCIAAGAGMSVQCAVLYAVFHRQRGCGICWPDFARGEECLCRGGSAQR